jgi:hypothetical protein
MVAATRRLPLFALVKLLSLGERNLLKLLPWIEEPALFIQTVKAWQEQDEP